MKVSHTIAIPLDELQRRYAALPEIMGQPCERTWSDRLKAFEAFLESGPLTAHWIKFDVPLPDFHRELNPELWDLVIVAFPQDDAEP